MSADSPYRSPEDVDREFSAERSSASPGHVRYWVLTFLGLAAMLSYMPRVSLSVAEQAIRQDLELTTQQMGWMLSGFFWSYSLFQVPAGWFSQRTGSRKALTIFAAGWSACTLWSALASGQIALNVSRLVMGVAQAGVFPASTQTIAHWFPASRRAFPSGALGSLMSLGTAIGVALTGFLLPEIGWRWTFFLFSLPGFMWAIAFFIWFRDRPRDHSSVRPAELALIATGGSIEANPQADQIAARTPWLALISSPALWCICGQQVFRASGYALYTSWFATLLKEGLGVSTDWAAGLLNMLPVLMVVPAGFIGGALSDWILARTHSRRAARQGLATISIVACAAMFFLAYSLTQTWLVVGAISLGSFFVSLAGPCAYSITIDMGGRHVSVVFSVMNMAGNIGAAIFPLVVPALVALWGWNSVLLLVGCIYVASAVCWLALRPEGTICQQSWVHREAS